MLLITGPWQHQRCMMHACNIFKQAQIFLQLFPLRAGTQPR